jgi:NAD(P)H-hydrate epimerase
VRSLVRVVTSAQSAARDASAIGADVPSRALMQRAGAAAAAEIALRFHDRLGGGVAVFAGPGNNGGDAWVVARALAASGVRVRVIEPVPAKTPDAFAERALALEALGDDDAARHADDCGEALIIDGLLGTGSAGAPRGEIGAAVATVRVARRRGAVVVALDLPTGVDASTGASNDDAVDADLTLTFGTIKRGHVLQRDRCGTVVVLDIGLGRHAALDDSAPQLIDEAWVAAQLPRIAADSNKGTRKKLAIVGGARGMAGAAMLAARAALRSGVGMVKLVVAPETLPIVQEAEPYALAAEWPRDDHAVEQTIGQWADAVVIGPGLGRDDQSRALLDRVLACWRGPTLLDADALTIFEKRASELGAALGGRPAIITPHPVEFSRLAGVPVDRVLDQRFDVGAELAGTLGATVLLKGVPTVITSPTGARLVSATGTPALATAGSGDVLSGIAGTLLAQIGDPSIAAAASAWVHGRAAERVPSSGGVRGVALEDIVNELRGCWLLDDRPLRYPVLAELPAVGSST